MDRADLIKQIESYCPYNEQEETDRRLILTCLKEVENIFDRGNCLAHMTASAWVVNPGRTKVLMVYHNIYKSWSWLGGHGDNEQDLLEVAVREVREESGLARVRPVSKDIYSLEVLTVAGHVKMGKYVGSHLHLNVTYLLEADENDALFSKADENSGAAWFGLEDALRASSEPWMCQRIYAKLNEKLKRQG